MSGDNDKLSTESFLSQEMVDEVTEKGKELQELKDGVSDYVTNNSDTKTEETEGVKEKLKLVQEEYTIILRAVSTEYWCILSYRYGRRVD